MRLRRLTGHESWRGEPAELPPAARRLESLVLAECVRLSRLAGAAQCRLHDLERATGLLAQLCRARWHLEASERAWRKRGAPGDGPGAERLIAALRAAATVRLEVVEQLHELRPLVGLERFDVRTAPIAPADC